jgi:hypothetical protein
MELVSWLIGWLVGRSVSQSVRQLVSEFLLLTNYGSFIKYFVLVTPNRVHGGLKWSRLHIIHKNCFLNLCCISEYICLKFYFIIFIPSISQQLIYV